MSKRAVQIKKNDSHVEDAPHRLGREISEGGTESLPNIKVGMAKFTSIGPQLGKFRNPNMLPRAFPSTFSGSNANVIANT